jgi:hypothetical protein
MKKIGFIKYEAPEMEVLEVEVEKGFAMSDGSEEGDGNASAGGMGGLN